MTRPLSPPPPPFHHHYTTGMCGVWVFMYGNYVRVDSWCLFMFTSEEKWIQGGGDSDGRSAELLLSKAFLSLLLHFGFHLRPFLLQNIRQTS